MVAASAPLRFSGVAHPPPGSGGLGDGSDLSAGEITWLGSGRLNGRPILREHTGHELGRGLTSWESQTGALCIEAVVVGVDGERQQRRHRHHQQPACACATKKR